MSFTKPMFGQGGRWRAPTVKETLDPVSGARDMRNLVEGKGNRSADVNPLSPKKPAAPGAPPPPIIEDVAGREQDTMDMLRRRRGRAASVLTDGNAGVPMTASKTLLGS